MSSLNDRWYDTFGGCPRPTDAPIGPLDLLGLEESRIPLITPREYSGFAASATKTIASLTGGPGNMESIQISLATSGSDTETSKLNYDSLIRFVVDGETAFECDLGTFMLTHGTQDAANAWITDDIAVTMADPVPGNVSGFRRLMVPYQDTLLVQLVNASSSATATVWSQVAYRTGVLPFCVCGSRRKRLLAQVTPLSTTLNPYQTMFLLDVAGRGQVEGIHFFTQGANHNIPTWLEGNPTWIIDGVTSAYGGTEDFFGTTFYGNATGGLQSDSWGIPQRGPIASINGYGIGAFRFFRKDPVVFDETCQLRWQNGSAGQGPLAPPTINLSAIVFYHLDDA